MKILKHALLITLLTVLTIFTFNFSPVIAKTTEKSDIKKASFLYATDFIYSKTNITPKITVKYNKTTLKQNIDYTVTYKNNKNIGSGSINIRGIGKFFGSVTKHFNINPTKTYITSLKATANATISLTWKKVDSAGGYDIYYSTKKNGPFEKLATIKKNSSCSYKSEQLQSNTKYYFTVTANKIVKNVKYSSMYSATRYVKTTSAPTYDYSGTYKNDTYAITVTKNDNNGYDFNVVAINTDENTNNINYNINFTADDIMHNRFYKTEIKDSIFKEYSASFQDILLEVSYFSSDKITYASDFWKAT